METPCNQSPGLTVSPQLLFTPYMDRDNACALRSTEDGAQALGAELGDF